MKKAIITFLPIFLIIFISCKECPCTPAELRFDLIGFSNTEADTFIIREFEPNGNFSIKKATFLISNPAFARFNDTLRIVAVPGTSLLKSQFDYEIFFPGSNSLFRITEINEQRSTQNCGGIFSTDKVGCYNTIKSLKINGTVIDPWPFNSFYIHK